MPANPWRGEVELILDSKPYILRPTFEALQRIEQELDIGFIALAKKIASGDVTLNELAVLTDHCFTANGRLPRNILCESILKNGIGNALAPIATLCTYVLDGFYHE